MMQETQVTADTRGTDSTIGQHSHEDHEQSAIIIDYEPASSSIVPGSTTIAHLQETEASQTQVNTPELTVAPVGTVTDDDTMMTNTNPEEALITPSLSEDHSVDSIKPSITSTDSASSEIPTSKRATASTTNPPQPERHILSYEQWRKQVLNKKNKPAEVAERKQRKRKPYQENAIDVAIGGEEEIGFVFPNLDNGNNKGDERAQIAGDQFGNGPDLKLIAGSDREWIKSEYAKDPKDRFNHASATCAASVVKASKDATSISAILNEGKDNYMLIKCSTKGKFFVVELCEEILVDTFVLGNYEFFSSTFKDFIVSVNRYPPRDDGWSILGQFQARNTRDAQVFKPAVPQLATYIRFDFMSHYGNEYYCPITLLRVYGATALEQLKQEEEEEKRIAEEEKRRAELEKAELAVMEAEDDDDESEVSEIIEEETDTSAEILKDHLTSHKNEADSISDNISVSEKPVETRQDSTGSNTPLEQAETNQLQTVFDSEPLHPASEKDTADTGSGETQNDPHFISEQSPTSQPTFVLPEWSTNDFDDELYKEDSTLHHGSGATESSMNQLGETILTSTDQILNDVLQPLPSTTPASMQDDDDWRNGDLGIVTLSSKQKTSHASKPQNGSKLPSAGLGTHGGYHSATDTSAHPQPTTHSSQESVYKNIVNRLKALELNSSLSYQYLEEQSNVFNEVLEANEQKINQLVTHLNEAHRRLETLGRKYDQLAYSYRSHVEVDGEKQRQEFINLSSQVHLLGSQLVFQRQLFVVGAIILFSVIAFITITRSSSMQYAIHQSPLGIKLRAMSRHKGSQRSNDITSSVRIGSVEALSQFDQSTFRAPHIEDNRVRSEDDDVHLTPPISPMTPLTPDHGFNESGHMQNHQTGAEASFRSDESSHIRQNGEVSRSIFAGESHPSQSRTSSQSETTGRQSESPDMQSFNLNENRFLVTRTPYPTPKSSHGSGKLLLHPNSSHPSTNVTPFPLDYRPDSPVFQGPSDTHDDGQLSDADVAYMSRDMNVGRTNTLSSGSQSVTPAAKRLSISYYNQFHHASNRPSSSLRMDTTAFLTSDDRAQHSPDHEDSINGKVDTLPSDIVFRKENDAEETSPISTKPMVRASDLSKDLDDDIGFVSDSVLDSTSGSMVERPDRESVIGDWDSHHGAGVILPEEKSEDDEDHNLEVIKMLSKLQNSRQPSGALSDTVTTGEIDLNEEHSRLSKNASLKSRRRSSHSIHRSQEHLAANRGKNHSASATVGLGVGLGLELAQSSEIATPSNVVKNHHDSSLVQQQIRHQNSNDLAKDEKHDDGIIADNDDAVVPGQSVGRGERRRRTKGPVLSEDDQSSPRRRASYGLRENERDVKEEQALEGDDEKSPQLSKKP
ncbi:hypothetical protein FBU30_002058 [Linnemannia zychae]|nr:hypothetical protein FBU30_002058 [Linnemannia zychae]